MQRKYHLFIDGFLVFLNFVCWKEIFVLADERLKVDFLNVGQGDSAFIETPENHQIIIDGGPSGAVLLGKLASLMPFWDKTLDLVVLTHPESDHMNGLLEILKRYKADYILWSGVKKSAPEYTAWIDVLEKQKKMGAKIIIADSGQEIRAGNVLIDTLFPLENMEGKEMKSTSNDSCVVSKIIFGKNSFIFTGDIDDKAEKDLVESGENISADVLKVAHHGSKYSTSELFLENVRPKFAVIEVGKNSYGHPTPEVLQRLQNYDIKTLRTDKIGDIKFVSDGKNIKVN